MELNVTAAFTSEDNKAICGNSILAFPHPPSIDARCVDERFCPGATCLGKRSLAAIQDQRDTGCAVWCAKIGVLSISAVNEWAAIIARLLHAVVRLDVISVIR